MADFRTHVTTSSVLGVGYAGMGMAMGLPIESSLVAGGLCGISGMLPDLDSDSGIPIREAMGFAAGIVPMLLVDRFQAIGMPYDRMVLITAGLYFLIRFAGASLLGRFTVHRGMFHSIPAVLIFSGLAFLICGPSGNMHVRYFKAGAVFFGAMSHLFLDELWSIEWKGGTWRFKRSFGTALKLWGKSGWANFSAYAKLAIVGTMVAGEPSVTRYLEQRYPEFAGNIERIHDAQENLLNNVRSHVIPEPATNDAGETLVATPSPQPTAPPASAFPQAPPLAQPQVAPESYAPGGFKPNAGQVNPGYAQPVYRADSNGFQPR